MFTLLSFTSIFFINFFMDFFTIGIIGAGQLGMMLIKYGIRKIAPSCHIKVLSPSLECSCSKVDGVDIITGSLQDETDIRRLCQGCDVVTWEIENVNVDALLALKSEGVQFVPEPGVLGLIQNKATQKIFYKKNKIPTLPFCITDQPSIYWDELSENAPYFKYDGFGNRVTSTVVYKDLTDGYDGHGVQIVSGDRSGSRMMKPDEVPDRFVVVEPYVGRKREFSVIVAKDAAGTIVTYEPTEMTFHAFRNILNECYPAQDLSDELEERLRTVAKDVVVALGSPGVFAVEMFLIFPSNKIVVNETAPRVHNSGHHTVHSHTISQFEMLATIMFGQCIIPPSMHSTYVMRNLLGSPNPLDEGAYRFRNRRAVLPDEGPYLIDYGKGTQRPWRKLGHITHIRQCATVPELREELSAYCQGISVEAFAAVQTPPQIAVVMGSKSDWPVMKEACDLLKKFDIDYEATVVSAHRTPERMAQYAKTARERGLKVIIAGAGGSAHLPGMLAAQTTVPVIGVPVASERSKAPHAALWSIVQMPPGVPVACMAINGARNAAIFALQMLGHHSIIQLMREDTARDVMISQALLE
jgi:phosphoribosylaminoimidazole carboxylase